MSIIIQIMAILLARDLVWSKENPIEPLAHILKVKESSIEALSDFQGSSNGDVEKSVDSNSLSRSWVWFPTKQDLKTHYVCIRGWTSLFGSDSDPWHTSRRSSLLDVFSRPKSDLDQTVLTSKCRFSCGS